MCFDPLRFIQWFNDLVGLFIIWAVFSLGRRQPIFFYGCCRIGPCPLKRGTPTLPNSGSVFFECFHVVSLRDVIGGLGSVHLIQTVLNGPAFASGHTALNTPDPIRTRKLSSARPGQYWGGGPPGKSLGCCWLFACIYVHKRVVTKSAPRRPTLKRTWRQNGNPL